MNKRISESESESEWYTWLHIVCGHMIRMLDTDHYKLKIMQCFVEIAMITFQQTMSYAVGEPSMHAIQMMCMVCTCQRESWAPRHMTGGCHSGNTNGRNIDLLGGILTVKANGRVQILMEKSFLLPNWVSWGGGGGEGFTLTGALS